MGIKGGIMPIATPFALPGLPASITQGFSTMGTISSMKLPDMVIQDGPIVNSEYYISGNPATNTIVRKLVVAANLSRCTLDYFVCEQNTVLMTQHCYRVSYDAWWAFFLQIVRGGPSSSDNCCTPSYFNPCERSRCC